MKIKISLLFLAIFLSVGPFDCSRQEVRIRYVLWNSVTETIYIEVYERATSDNRVISFTEKTIIAGEQFTLWDSNENLDGGESASGWLNNVAIPETFGFRADSTCIRFDSDGKKACFAREDDSELNFLNEFGGNIGWRENGDYFISSEHKDAAR